MPQDVSLCLPQPRLPNKVSWGLKDHDSWKLFAGTYFAPYVLAVAVPLKCV